MHGSREQRIKIEEWVYAQPECPTRDQVKRKFPGVGQKHIRSAIQSRKDRERTP